MDYTRSAIISIFVSALLLLGLLFPQSSRAQTGESYQFVPAPDIWYNSVDGIRLGVRLRGKMSGSFRDGPHRLDAGLWLGTKIPTHPVSYYLSLTEPIPSFSDFGSEANIQIRSSYRTGFQAHGISFNKRWQAGFDEKNYTEISLGLHAEHRFDAEYLLYSQLWQNQWLYPLTFQLLKTHSNALGRSRITAKATANVLGKHQDFITGQLSLQQHIPLSESFEISGRFFTSLASKNTAPEYLYTRSMKSARGWMNSGLTRARGTIPPAWMRTGGIQVAGGSNLRGYLHRDIAALNNDNTPLYTSLSSINMELRYPNPLDHALNNIPVLGKFISLRSYLFFDGGTSLGLTELEESKVLADAGPGFMFTLNIPDFLGKSRGLMIRYDMPLWLSDPGPENHFKFRNVVGIGTIISL